MNMEYDKLKLNIFRLGRIVFIYSIMTDDSLKGRTLFTDANNLTLRVLYNNQSYMTNINEYVYIPTTGACAMQEALTIEEAISYESRVNTLVNEFIASELLKDNK